MEKVEIIKASGEREPFSEQKLRRSLQKANTPPALVAEIVAHIRSELKEGVKTSEIYRHAFSLLKSKKHLSAGRYSIKKALLELGPSGYPFEKMVAELLKSDGYTANLMSFLFGNILIISNEQLLIMFILDIVTIVFVAVFYKQLVAISFDIEFATIRSIKVNIFYLLLLCLVAVTVVLLIRVVGLILVIALLTLPAAIAGQYVHSLGRMMVVATLLGSLFTSFGLAVSYGPDLPVGPTIILLAGAAYVLSASGGRLVQRWLSRFRLRQGAGGGRRG